MNTTAERGGPFVRASVQARNWMRAAPPGIGRRAATDESSPVGGGGPCTTVTPACEGASPPATPPSVRRVRLKRLLTLTAGALALGGAAMLGEGAYIHAKAALAQVLLERAWQRERVTGEPVKPWPWADTHAVARLHAPAQDADVLVLAGASGRTLAFGPGHLDGSALPGDAGNAVITAHRDTHFRFLRAVATGDEIVVERAGGAVRRFRIRDAYVADQRSLRIPRDTDVPTLTLVTCYPFDAIAPGGPLRYVVVAESAPPGSRQAGGRTLQPSAGVPLTRGGSPSSNVEKLALTPLAGDGP